METIDSRVPEISGAGDLHPSGKTKIGEEVDEILRDLPDEKRSVIIQAIENFSGPLPHPRILRGYEDVKEGFAERIVAMAEREQAHRHCCEDKVVRATTTTTKRGQWLGFIIAILFLIASFILAILGNNVVASILGGGTLVSLVTIFVSNKPGQRADESRDPATQETAAADR